MKIRTYFKNKKLSQSRPITPYRTESNPLRTENVIDKPNYEQLACYELIEQSWNNVLDQGHDNVPDNFLRMTPVPHGRNDGNKNNFKQLSLSDIKVQSNKNTLKQHRKLTKTQQSFQPQNQHYISEKLPNCFNSHLFVGKQALNLTQYIIAGPQCTINSTIESPHKLERSKYIRILKQMKNRQEKRNQRQLEEEKIRQNMSLIKSFITEKQRQMDRLFISSQRIKVKKDKKSYSLRNKTKSLTLDSRNFLNRFS